MAQLTGSAQPRTTRTLPFVAGTLFATALITALLVFAVAAGVRVQVPAIDGHDGVAPQAAPARPVAAPRPASYDGRIDPIERTYILKSRGQFVPDPRPQTSSGSHAGEFLLSPGTLPPVGIVAPATSSIDFGDDISRWHLVAK